MTRNSGSEKGGGKPPDRRTIRLEMDGFGFTIDVPSPTEQPALGGGGISMGDTMALPAHPPWQWLSELEAKAVLALCDVRELSRDEIARAVGVNADGDIKVLLRFLVKRHILDSTNGGYTLRVPDGAVWDEWRQAVRPLVTPLAGEGSPPESTS